ncbi:hypothetical protein L1887_24039 [Cichorium endivia]|nr:hypothetical protein L1887_24039 [Cichorium endivia]
MLRKSKIVKEQVTLAVEMRRWRNVTGHVGGNAQISQMVASRHDGEAGRRSGKGWKTAAIIQAIVKMYNRFQACKWHGLPRKYQLQQNLSEGRKNLKNLIPKMLLRRSEKNEGNKEKLEECAGLKRSFLLV